MSIVRVAKYAGVSTATVTRVLNSVPVVSPCTVRTAQAAIETLKYDPVGVKRGPSAGSRNRGSTTVKMIAVVPVVRAMGGYAEPVGVDHISKNNPAIGYLAHRYFKDHGCDVGVASRRRI